MTTDLTVRADLLAALEQQGWITPTALRIDDPNLSFDRYQALGVMLDRLHDASKFWLGDWLLVGEHLFGEEAAQAAAATRRSEKTLLRWAWVCRRVAPSRRRESLSFTHHTLVAPLEPAEQSEWLERAEAGGWSSRDLQAALRDRLALGAGERECADLVEAMARDLRAGLRGCGLDTTAVLVEVRGVGFSYEVRIP
jgi:hypothetical protein